MRTIALLGTPFGNAVIGARMAAPPVSVIPGPPGPPAPCWGFGFGAFEVGWVMVVCVRSCGFWPCKRARNLAQRPAEDSARRVLRCVDSPIATTEHPGRAEQEAPP